jgi:hypothetical protein
VARGGARYQAAGGLELTVRFAPGNYRLDDVKISSFDGMEFEPTASFMPTFTDNAYKTEGMMLKSGDGGGVTAELRGAFFGSAPAGQAPLETAGEFTMAGPGYQAAGVYAARR